MPGGSASHPPQGAEDEAARVAKLLRYRVRERSSVRAIEKALGWANGFLAGQLAGRVSLRLSVLFAVLHHLGIEPSDFFTELFPSSPRQVVGAFGGGSLYPSQAPRDPEDLAPSLERQRRTDEALEFLFKELERVGVLDRKKVETAERILEGEEKGRGKS
jgi:transcriptional regulator with XRE-family HTH domain